MTRLSRAKTQLLFAAAGVFLLVACAASSRAQLIHNHVFFESAREKIREESFRRESVFEGAQLKYTWRELELAPGKYDFHAIRDDLAPLKACGKRLFLQIQDVTFTPAGSCLPGYLLRDPQYHGGANRQYDIVGANESKPVVDGWIARRWDPAVEKRFERLLSALGEAFDGKVAGINLAETAGEFGETGETLSVRVHPGVIPHRYSFRVADAEDSVSQIGDHDLCEFHARRVAALVEPPLLSQPPESNVIAMSGMNYVKAQVTKAGHLRDP